MSEDSAQRLQNDLTVVMEKVQLCREIMLVSPGIEEDEMLANVVGYLEACRDRMADLIESGFQGLLGEELFEKVLSVNDAVNRTLEAERTGTKIAVNEEEVSAKKEKGDGKPLLDMGDEAGANSKLPAAAAPPAQEAPKPKQQDTLLAPYVPPAAPAASSFPDADPFGSDFVTKPFDDLPAAPPALPTESEKVYLPQASPLPPAPTALEAENVDVTPSVKDTTAVVQKKATPEAEAEDFDAFLESLGTTTKL